MQRPWLLMMVLVITLMGSLTGCWWDKPAATVNGEEISQQELDQMVEIYASNYQSEFNNDPRKDKELMKEIRQMALDNLVDQTILLQEAKKQGITCSNKETSDAYNDFKSMAGGEKAYRDLLKRSGMTDTQFKAEVKNRVIISKLMDKVTAGVTVTAEEARRYYKEHPGKYGKQVRVAHILVKTKEEALSVIEQLKKGADFEELARKVSIEPAAKQTGGVLPGYIEESASYVQEFKDAAMKLDAGEITEEPVATEFGYHVIKVLEVKPNSLQKYKDVEDKVIADARTAKQEEVWASYVARLKKAARIDINPKLELPEKSGK